MKKENKDTENLVNTSDELVLSTLEVLKEKGKEQNIPAVLDLIIQTDSESIRRAALDVMRDIKLKNAFGYVKEAIEKYRGNKHLSLLVALCWEAGFNCDHDLIFFTELAVKENYTVTLEVLTVVEHMSPAIPKEDVKTSIDTLNNSNEENDTKKHLLVEIQEAIKRLQ